jgi:hypothetical protein
VELGVVLQMFIESWLKLMIECVFWFECVVLFSFVLQSFYIQEGPTI